MLHRERDAVESGFSQAEQVSRANDLGLNAI